MSNLATIARPRTLAHVLLDIAEQRLLNERCNKRSDAARKAGDTAEEDRLADVGSAIDQRLFALEDEAKAMIADATGVSWEQLYDVLA